MNWYPIFGEFKSLWFSQPWLCGVVAFQQTVSDLTGPFQNGYVPGVRHLVINICLHYPLKVLNSLFFCYLSEQCITVHLSRQHNCIVIALLTKDNKLSFILASLKKSPRLCGVLAPLFKKIYIKSSVHKKERNSKYNVANRVIRTFSSAPSN